MKQSVSKAATASASAEMNAVTQSQRYFRKECRNPKCIHRNKNQTRTQLARKYANMTFFSCQRCSAHVADIVNGRTTPSGDQKVTQLIYCSHHCLNQDWQLRHQYVCAGRKDALGRKIVSTLDPAEVRRIEKSTPFIKTGQLRVAGQADPNEQALANMTLDELEFEGCQLGKGSYGMVQLAVHKPSGIKVAVKKLDKRMIKTPKMKETLRREIQIHKKLKHVNIVRMYADLEDNQYIYLVMEYVTKSNLFVMIKKEGSFTEETAFYFFIQTVAGIYFLHKNGFIHRDLKPENLLVNEDNVLKICDFGWTCESEMDEGEDGNVYEGQRNTFCGTLEYMAPEMINHRHHNHQLDIWALGILLYELVHGNAPFRGNQAAIARNQVRQAIAFKSKISQEYKDLVNKFLKEDADQRISLIQVFQHPWVLYFQQKFFKDWQPNESEDSQEDEDSASENEGESDEVTSSEGYDDEEEGEDDDDEELNEPSDAGTPRGGLQNQTPGGQAVTAKGPHQSQQQAWELSGGIKLNARKENRVDAGAFRKSTEYSVPPSDSGYTERPSEVRERPSTRVAKKKQFAIGISSNQENIAHGVAPIEQQQTKKPMEQLDQKEVDQETIHDEMSIDISVNGGLPPGHDVMADFGGFLEKRKRDKNMQRNTMMSQIDGMVSNLQEDMGSLMESARRIKNLRKYNQAQEDFKETADQKENLLVEDDLTEMNSVYDQSMMQTPFDNESVLQKRPSNPSAQQQRFSQRPSKNIFNKERQSAFQQEKMSVRSSAMPVEDFEGRPSKRQFKINKENSLANPQKQQRLSKADMNEASRIVARKMRQMDHEESMRGTQQVLEYDESEEDESSGTENSGEESDEAEEIVRNGKMLDRESDRFQTFGKQPNLEHLQRPPQKQILMSNRPVDFSVEEDQVVDRKSIRLSHKQRQSHKHSQQMPVRHNQGGRQKQNLHPEDSDEFEEVSEEEEEDSDTDEEEKDSDASEEEQSDGPKRQNKNKPRQQKGYAAHQRLSSRQFHETQEDYDSDLEKTMTTKYLEQSMMQQKQKGHQNGKTTYNPDFDLGRDTMHSRKSKTGQKSKHKHNKSISRLKKRAAGMHDYSLDFQHQYNHRVNETNPHSGHMGRPLGNYYKDQLSPHSRMILQSEAQFLDNYGRRSERHQSQFQNRRAIEENTIWDKLGRIFTFGCIETSHNNKQK